jgi:hypothetical protein
VDVADGSDRFDGDHLFLLKSASHATRCAEIHKLGFLRDVTPDRARLYTGGGGLRRSFQSFDVAPADLITLDWILEAPTPIRSGPSLSGSTYQVQVLCEHSAAQTFDQGKFTQRFQSPYAQLLRHILAAINLDNLTCNITAHLLRCEEQIGANTI